MPTQEEREKLVAMIRGGVDAQTAIFQVGLNPRAILPLLEEGKILDDEVSTGEKTGRILKREQELMTFWREFAQARADAVSRNVLLIQNAAKDDWKAAKYWLETQVPGTYGRMNAFGSQTIETIEQKQLGG